jgi:protein involved in polysaccharide export with SLBB domain
MPSWFRHLALAFTGLLLLTGCMSGGGGGSVMAAEQQAPSAYKLGVADKVRVSVFGQTSLSGEYTVGSAGTISFPLIGDVRASDRTIEELQTAIATGLADGYVNNPRVTAEVLVYRPFYILGEVNSPGEYPYTNNLTVLNAVATAEGFTYRANTRVVYIKRADEAGERAYALGPTTYVSPGDTIRIAERFF